MTNPNHQEFAQLCDGIAQSIYGDSFDQLPKLCQEHVVDIAEACEPINETL